MAVVPSSLRRYCAALLHIRTSILIVPSSHLGLCDALRTMLLVQIEGHRIQQVQERVVQRLSRYTWLPRSR